MFCPQQRRTTSVNVGNLPNNGFPLRPTSVTLVNIKLMFV